MGWLVLGAGFAHRFGSDKLLAPFQNGLSVIESTLQMLLNTDLPVVVVLRPEQQLVQAICTTLPVAVCLSPLAKQGMGHSLAAGITHVQPHWTWAGVVLADMPAIQPATFTTLAAMASARSIVRPSFEPKQGAPQPGHPVCFGCEFFNELKRLSGDEGARTVIDNHRNALIELPTDDSGVIRDVDTPKDLADLMPLSGLIKPPITPEAT